MASVKKKTAKKAKADVEVISEVTDAPLPAPPKAGKNGKAAIIYTDGGARPNPGPSGYGIWGRDSDSVEYNGWGFVGEMSTNNRAELEGFISAAELVIDNDIRHVTFFIDSKYVLEGIEKHLKGWVSNGWKKSTGDEISNKDLWIKTDKLLKTLKVKQIAVTYRWVKGHSGDPGNDAADANATRARLAAEKGEVSKVLNKETVSVEKTKKLKPASYNKMVAGRRLVFTTNTPMVTPEGERIYLSANFDDKGGAQAKNFGTEASDDLNAVLITKNRIEQFEAIIDYQNQITPDDFVQPVVLLMDKATKPANWQSLTDVGNAHLNHTRLNVVTVEGEPLTVYVRPPRRAYEGIDRLSALFDNLDRYRRNQLPKSMRVFDITEQLVSAGKKDTKVLSSITGSDKGVTVNLPMGKTTIPLTLTFNIDIPSRNHINAIGKGCNDMTIKLLAHTQTKAGFRYEVIIEANGDHAIYATSRANYKIIV